MSPYQKINRTKKRSVSIKMFIEELGEDFSEHVKKRLMDLETRCFLTRKDIPYRFDLKHVEHIKFDCASDENDTSVIKSKEYAYGQFAVIDGSLYFSKDCIENNEIMQSPIVSNIYNLLDSEGIVFDEGRNLKLLNENNIDHVIDMILAACPEVSQSYLDIVKGMTYRSNNK